MYAIVLIRYRVPLEEVLKAQDEHRAYLRQLKAEGILLAAGPMDPRSGGMLLVRFPDGDVQGELTKLRDGDPYYFRQLAHYEMIPWNPVMGKEELDKL
jgi:uncharacterized protein YciI